MIAHLFELSGIDRVLAPFHESAIQLNGEEEDHPRRNGNEETCTLLPIEEKEQEIDFWEFVAPRGQHHRPSPPPLSCGASATTATDTAAGSRSALGDHHRHRHDRGIIVMERRLVECKHCHKMTPVDDTRMMHRETPHSIPNETDGNCYDYNNNNHDGGGIPLVDDDDETQTTREKSILHQRILQVARETASTLTAPTFLWEERHNLFAICAAQPKKLAAGGTAAATSAIDGNDHNNSRPKLSKNVKKLKRMLTTKSPHLLLARSANMGSTLGLPDGFTILHAACYVGNVEVVEYLLKHHVDTDTASAGDLVVGSSRDDDSVVVDDDDDKSYSGRVGGGGDSSSGGGNGVSGTGEESYGEEKDGSTKDDSSSQLGEGGNEDKGRDIDDNKMVRSVVAATAKIDLNEVDMQGRTALHIASERGHIEVILVLKTAYDKIKEQHEKQQRQLQQMFDDEGKALEENEACDVNEKSTPYTTTPPLTTLTTPKTPMSSCIPSSSPSSHRANATQSLLSLRSPQPPSSSYSKNTTPTFAGPRAPVDLAGRTPLGYAATSPVPKARQNRSALEKVLYVPGDRSIVGHGGCAERTPPRARCGPSTTLSSSSSSSSLLSPMATVSTAAAGRGSSSIARRERRTPPNSSYLSPTPNSVSNYAPPSSSIRRPRSAMSTTTSNYATPFQSPPTILEEATVGDTSTSQRKNCLQWGASEMNGWRILMEDKILVKYEVYGDEAPPPPPIIDFKATTGDPISMGLFGVFDGHGDGGFASNYIATNVWDKLQSQPDWTSAYHGCNSESTTALLSSIISQACHDLDEGLRNEKTKPSSDGGSTAIMALICDRYLFVANVGDSRCILVKKKTAMIVKERDVATSESRNKPCWESSDIDIIPMSEDHKPNLPEERARIESSGLTVQTDHVPSDSDDGQIIAIHRVKKSNTELLGVARAFGDYDFKSNDKLSAHRQAVVCTPDIVVRERMDDEDMFLILACDGIWDVMSNQEVGEFVARRVAERLDEVSSINTKNNNNNNNNNTVQGEVLARVGDDLLALCLDKKSRDNMSVLIVAFPASGLTTSESSLSARGKDEIWSANLASVSDVAVRTLAFE